MSQFARPSRSPSGQARPARPATAAQAASASRPAASHASVVTARLRKLASAGSTGTLPFVGGGEGAIYFLDGTVVGAESARPPGLRAQSATAAGSQGDQAAADRHIAPLPAAGLVEALRTLEPVVDAVLDLLTSPSGCSKFQSTRGKAGPDSLARPDAALPADATLPVNATLHVDTAPPVDTALSVDTALPVDALLSELTRRRRLLDQMSEVVTADTVVTRAAQLDSPRIQVSALQWALLTRVRAGVTPRAFAFELGHGVFGTTVEVYRLVAMRLLSPAGQPGPAEQTAPRDAIERGLTPLSFIRAVSP
jgi:hypothetical protein